MSQTISIDDIKHQLKSHKAQPGARHRDPELTRIVDLTPDPDSLLTTISQSTRSFIRKNQRQKFITFRTASDPAEIKLFINMLGKVSARNNVFFFSNEYFQKQAELLMPLRVMHLEFALYNDRPIAAAIFHDYGSISAYTFAASLPEARQINASALLLWQGMLNAKKRGIAKLDLFGIAPDNASSDHPWHGFTAFKAKFGGQMVARTGNWDIALSPKYRLYRQAHKVRKFVKRH